MICTNCGAQHPEGTVFCTNCGTKLAAQTRTSNQGMDFDFSTNTASSAAKPDMYEYKVLSQKDKWFSGKFDPIMLEQALNAYAQQGWRVIGCATADVAGFGAARQEFITLLERKR